MSCTRFLMSVVLSCSFLAGCVITDEVSDDPHGLAADDELAESAAHADVATGEDFTPAVADPGAEDPEYATCWDCAKAVRCADYFSCESLACDVPLWGCDVCCNNW